MTSETDIRTAMHQMKLSARHATERDNRLVTGAALSVLEWVLGAPNKKGLLNLENIVEQATLAAAKREIYSPQARSTEEISDLMNGLSAACDANEDMRAKLGQSLTALGWAIGLEVPFLEEVCDLQRAIRVLKAT